MQDNLPEAFLVLVFRATRAGLRPNLTAFCQQRGASAAALGHAIDFLERRGLLGFGQHGEKLTLAGLAMAAALSRRASERDRPLAACGRLAA